MSGEQLPSDSLSSWPERIYLQRDWGCVDDTPHEETTWCAEKIHDVDVEYVRADIVERLREQIKALGGGYTKVPK